MKAHKHKDVIIAWANGSEIQARENSGYEWQDLKLTPCFSPTLEYRVKPDREYPVTSLTDNDLRDCYHPDSKLEAARRSIANAAIKQYIIDTEGNA